MPLQADALSCVVARWAIHSASFPPTVLNATEARKNANVYARAMLAQLISTSQVIVLPSRPSNPALINAVTSA